MRVLRGLGGKTLDCSCSVGTYELYDGKIVTVIDVRGKACPHPTHRRNAQIVDDQPSLTVAVAGAGSSRK
jgi:hypothetical protein